LQIDYKSEWKNRHTIAKFCVIERPGVGFVLGHFLLILISLDLMGMPMFPLLVFFDWVCFVRCFFWSFPFASRCLVFVIFRPLYLLYLVLFLINLIIWKRKKWYFSAR
jgi:hypothetical protein